ncbi:S1 family peptidase [Mycobacterium heidelbergense]|uniref:S1 family peptidase n=1 Tax=Mycobacterium heidelbergense TaxID=53376 RepID=UPI003CF8A3C4
MGSALPKPEGVIGDKAFVELGLTSWSSAIVPVVVMSANRIQCIGTAFNISPFGVWVTAAHVMDEADALVASTPGSNVGLVWVGSGVGENVVDLLGGAIPINFCDRRPSSDLALLRTDLRRQNGHLYPLPHLNLSARMRRVGTPIAGLGYTRFNIQSDITNSDGRRIVVEPNFHMATGEVTRLYPERRDSAMLPSACFETSARFDGGMSGGPLICQDGWVCGVVSTGGLGSDDDGYTSFASATPVIFLLELQEGAQTQSVYEMVQRGLVIADQYFPNLEIVEQGERVGISFAIER